MQHKPKPVLPGFEHVKRYWDNTREKVVAKVLPGEFYVSKQDELITTVLGSCIAACVYDEKMGLGGMNHFMLPIEKTFANISADSLNCRYGNWAMEHLINEILKNGGIKERLKVKLFGGGRILRAMTDIGDGNIQFAHSYLNQEHLALVSQDVGGSWPRKIVFDPETGKVQVKKLRSLHNDTIQKREVRYMHEIEQQEVSSGDIELF